MLFNSENHWNFELSPSSGILGNCEIQPNRKPSARLQTEKKIQFPKRRLFFSYLDTRTMDKVQEPGDSENCKCTLHATFYSVAECVLYDTFLYFNCITAVDNDNIYHSYFVKSFRFTNFRTGHFFFKSFDDISRNISSYSSGMHSLQL